MNVVLTALIIGCWVPYEMKTRATLSVMGLDKYLDRQIANSGYARSVHAAASVAGADDDVEELASVSSASSSSSGAANALDIHVGKYVFMLLLNSLPDAALEHIRDVPEGNPHGLWCALRAVYARTTKHNVKRLKQVFDTLKQLSGQPLDAFVAAINTATMNLRAAGINKSDEERTDAFIEGLLPVYSVQSEMLSVTNGGFTHTVDILLSIESKHILDRKIAADKREEVANMAAEPPAGARTKSGNSSRGGSSSAGSDNTQDARDRAAHAQRGGHGYSRGGRGGGADISADRRPPHNECMRCGGTGHRANMCTGTLQICAICRHPGHHKRSCPTTQPVEPAAAAPAAANLAEDEYFEDDDNNMVTIEESALAAVLAPTLAGATQWVLDSGCSGHMASSAVPLSNVKVDPSRNIKTASGELLGSPSVGDVTLALAGGEAPIALTGVLAHLKLQSNLLSISRMCDEHPGSSVLFTSTTATLIHGDGRRVPIGERNSRGIYVTKSHAVDAQPHAALLPTAEEASAHSSISEQQSTVALASVAIDPGDEHASN